MTNVSPLDPQQPSAITQLGRPGIGVEIGQTATGPHGAAPAEAIPWGHQPRHMGVSINGGTPKWLVYKGNPIEIDNLGGTPHLWKPPYPQ